MEGRHGLAVLLDVDAVLQRVRSTDLAEVVGHIVGVVRRLVRGRR